MAITLTERAADEVKRFMQDQKLDEDVMLRVSLTGGGCGGFNYALGFAEAASYDRKTDSTWDQHGVAVVSDKKSALYLDGATLDFADTDGRRGFMFDNPNEVKVCGTSCTGSAGQ